MDAPWYRDLVIYEVYVRGFFDSNGDGVGDLPGLTQKLGYIRDLGVDAIWLLPIFPSPLRDDGYDIADFTAVHPELGTLEDFKLLVEAAHAIGLRVLLDLVLNHTSDQHPWFQSARRGPGHPFHDHYVWNPTPDRYAGARVIFCDAQQSNWTLEPTCGLYYWHRFTPHQPDLNYENPDVRRAMLDVVRFWLDLGVDGFRVDAAPFLFEREGTSCENLPETHAFFRELRLTTDAYAPPRLLVVEANQRLPELIPYFGTGDEFHVAFHFPLMPRLFLAIHKGDAGPLVELLGTEPPIPASCQWAMFLRNHDELTLEMVSEPDRQYLLAAFARDPAMRLNLGIRRRLWPLMEGGRRAIELLHAMMLSLPGGAALYYGDEIGMGDNTALGDRMGVRTPMQWTPGANAGFSTAPPEKLYLPVVLEPEYHYAGHNVASLDRKPTSFLNWLRRMLKTHSGDPAFRGRSMRILPTGSPAVLAFVRENLGRTVLCVSNFSRFVQTARVDLAAWRGRTPVEIIGGAPFPPVGEEPYFFTMGPHSFYWLRLEER